MAQDGRSAKSFQVLLPVANSQLRAAVANGVIRLDLRPRSYGWTFIPTSGSFGDSGSGACH